MIGMIVLLIAVLGAGLGIGHYSWPIHEYIEVEADTVFSTSFLRWEGNETNAVDCVPCDTWVKVTSTSRNLTEDIWVLSYSVQVDCEPTPASTRGAPPEGMRWAIPGCCTES